MMNFYSSDNASPFFAAPEEVLEDNQEKVSKTIRSPDIDQLYKARDRLREFIHQIGALKYEGIRKDTLDHCDKIKINLSQHLTHEKVGKMVKNRIQKMIKNKRIKKNWSEQDVLILIWIVSKYADMKEIAYIERDLTLEDWNYIAELIPGVAGESCMFKWLSLKKNNLSENNWAQKQSNLLEKIVKIYGEENWPLISQELYYANTSQMKIYRCPKQCREHWNCYLNPNLKKGPWSKQEDQLLLSNVRKNNGQKKWAEIVKLFNGRTENALKNRFTLIMEKQAKNHPCGKSISEIELIDEYLQRTFVEQFVNIKEENKNREIEEKVKAKQSKKQENKKNPPRQIRVSLRRRHSTRTLGQRKPYSFQQDSFEKEIKKQQENHQEHHHEIYYPSDFINPMIEQQFSEPCRHLKADSQIFYDEELQVTQDKKKQNQIETYRQFPEGMQGIQVVPFNKDLFANFQNLGQMYFVPCVLTQNKLSKID